MNYINRVKLQVFLWIWVLLSWSITSAVLYYFGWAKPIILNQTNIIVAIFSSLIFIFFGASMSFKIN